MGWGSNLHRDWVLLENLLRIFRVPILGRQEEHPLHSFNMFRKKERETEGVKRKNHEGNFTFTEKTQVMNTKDGLDS